MSWYDGWYDVWRGMREEGGVIWVCNGDVMEIPLDNAMARYVSWY